MPGTMELVALLFGAIAAFALLEATIRRTLVGTALVLVATALVTTFPIVPDLWLGSTRIDFRDVVATLLLVAAVARLLRAHEISSLQWLLIAFGVLALVSLAQGIGEHGVNTAANGVRKYFWFLSIALYFSTAEPEPELLDRIARAWLVLAAFLVFLTLLRWLPLPSGILAGAFDAGGFRVLPAASTLILLQGFVIGAVAWIRGEASTWVRRLTPVLLAAVVLLQHRSVWAVLLATVAAVFLVERRAATKLVPVMAAGLVTIAVVSLAVLDEEAVEVPTQLAESATFLGTWEWRVEGWQVLIEQAPRAPVDVVVGQSFGTGFQRVMDGAIVNVSPHNFYVETYLSLGLLGLGFLVVLYGAALWRLSSNPGHGLLSSRALFLLILTHPVFSIPYSPAPEQGVVLGLAIAAASLVPSSRAVIERSAAVKP